MNVMVTADLSVRREVYECPCDVCRTHSRGPMALEHEAINRVMATLDERQRRLFVGLLARHRGHGGILTLAEITGMSRTTIRRGIEELRHGIDPAEQRVRRRGAGRRPVEKKTRLS
jgi:hypothetical protein